MSVELFFTGEMETKPIHSFTRKYMYLMECWPRDGQKTTHRLQILVPNSIPNPNPTLYLTPTLPHGPGNLCRTDKNRGL